MTEGDGEEGVEVGGRELWVRNLCTGSKYRAQQFEIISDFRLG
jgi:hypothetical protein